MGDLDPRLIGLHSSLGPPESVHNSNGISISSVVFAGLTIVTDSQTDRQTTVDPSVTIGRIYVLVRCGLKMGNIYGIINMAESQSSLSSFDECR